jgi:poly(3-hydroxybutyrate) depolymerase
MRVMSSAPGAGRHMFRDPRPGALREITIHTYKPASFTPSSPVVMVIAGRKRNADDYRDFWIADADRRGLFIVAPEFDEAQYVHPHAYNYGAMCRPDGTITDRSEWLFSVIEAIFQDVRMREGATRERYFLFGHSAGSQLVHRLAIFGWSPSIERAIAANAGSYTAPSVGEDFPFGLGGMEISDDVLRSIFERPLVIQLGDRDVDPNDEHLPREPAAMLQGAHRFARGQYFMQVARDEARRVGAAFSWRLAIAPGVAHSGEQMSPFAAREFFGP